MANPSPGAKAHPEHTIELTRGGRQVRVELGGKTIADTRDAITLREATYPPVFYIPMKDVDRDSLVASEFTTTCPFKGEARYWSITAGSTTSENAVWAYDRPYDEVADIAGHVAFYPNKVTIRVA